MYNEDDTFNALMKVPVNEILDVFLTWHDDHSDKRGWETVLEGCKWTEHEWNNFRAGRPLAQLIKDAE